MGAVYTNRYINKVRKDTTCSSDCTASSSESPQWIWYLALRETEVRTPIADVMLSHQLRDQTTDGGVAGLGAKFTSNTNTVISLCTLLLLPIVACEKKRGQVPTAQRGSTLSFSSRFVLCLLFLRDKTYRNYH